MKQYLYLLQDVFENGTNSDDRTGTGTISTFGKSMEFDLTKGFPLLTTKKLSFKNILTELIWIISGKESTSYLKEHNNTIWDEWTSANGGYLFEGYGKQWRKFGLTNYQDEYVDQLKNVINDIKTNPYSRRHVVTAWNPTTVDKATLPPCHILFQFYVRNGKLSCSLYQRSADLFLGVPYNIASYSLLTHIIAHLTNLTPHKFVWFGGDVHIYNNHLSCVKTQLQRDYDTYSLPTIEIDSALTDIDQLTTDHVKLLNYRSYPSIKAEVSV
jgi:thymidylate synthase